MMLRWHEHVMREVVGYVGISAVGIEVGSSSSMELCPLGAFL